LVAGNDALPALAEEAFGKALAKTGEATPTACCCF
jgi:hypothetical protein